MAEPTLSVTFWSLIRDISSYLGLRSKYIELSENDKADVDTILEEGYRDFLFPPPFEGQEHPRHVWSFLSVDATLSLVDADFDYDLPDNFGNYMSSASYSSGEDKVKLEPITRESLIQLRSRDSTKGTAKYYSWRPKTHDATVGERYEAIFYPTPDASLTLNYQYRVIPEALTVANIYPRGGGAFATPLRASILAAAERFATDGERTLYAQRWNRELAAAIQLDAGEAK